MKIKGKIKTAKKAIMKAIIAFIFCFGLSNLGYSNNVNITNAYLGHDTIRFDIQWDNSWRNSNTPNSTQNYDGVWVFVKYRDACDKPGISNYPAAYKHVWLVNDTAVHVVDSSVLKQMGTTNVGGTDRGMGIFLYRKYDGSGTFPAPGKTQVTLIWDQAAQAATNGNWDIRINAIEMVYIPQGSFRIGASFPTINGQTAYTYCTNYNTGLSPFLITSENALAVNTAPGGVGGLNIHSATTAGTLSANYPKGYDAFWCMKNEVSQGQYVDFLNSLDRQEQLNCTYFGTPTGWITITATTVPDQYRWAMYTTTVASPYLPKYRQYIRAPQSITAYMPIVFGCDANNNGTFNEADDGMNVACNYLYYNSAGGYGFFLRKYLDWAALRPITELEYEKVCRGPSILIPSQTNELVWGTDGSVSANRTPTSNLINPSMSTEAPVPAPGTVNGLYVGNNATGGPLRVGSTHATTTRIQAGSSFYGCADMAGNVYEWVWSFGNNGWVQGGFINPQMSRTDYGDGDMSTVPPAIWTNNASYMYRGGAWDQTNVNWHYLCISFRGTPGVNDQNAGGRGGRTSQ